MPQSTSEFDLMSYLPHLKLPQNTVEARLKWSAQAQDFTSPSLLF